MLGDFFIKNLDIVFFIYGVTFLVLGIIIFLQLRVTEKSEYRMLNILWLLAFFGVTHAMHEFMDMFALIKGEIIFLKIIGGIFLFISYLCLFLFGYQLINVSRREKRSILFPSIIIVLFFALQTFLEGHILWNNGLWDILTRYVLGFPGGILSAVGFLLYYQSESEKLSRIKVKKYFIFTALLFGIYGTLGGLIVPRESFFPASVINDTSFFAWFGIPVQFFRAISAIGIAFSILHVVNIFNIEEAAEHKRTEESLRESLSRISSMVEAFDGFVYICSKNYEVEFANKRLIERTGYNPVGQKCYKALHNLDNICPWCVNERVFKGETVRWEVQSPRDNNWYYIVNTPLYHTDGSISKMAMIHDITDRKSAEEALKRSEEKYRTLIDNIQDGVFIVQDAKIQFANEASARMAGYTVEEIIGKDFQEFVAPEDSEIVTNRYQRRQAGGEDVPKEYEFHALHKDGRTRVLVNMNVGLITFRGRVASMGTVKDITEKKRLESQLFRAQRMESIGKLAGGIAHDINNVLTPIMLSQELLQEKLTDEESKRLLNTIERSTKRGANLMKQIMSFARGIEGEHNALQVANLVSEIRQIAKETFPRSIETRTDIPEDLWTIYGDATQLHQVIMNLCVNARDAMPDGGILSICAENLFIDESYTKMNTEARIGPHIVITVSDTGTGLPPEIMDRIFEPFFTTKEHGKGTGLGLSTALGIVKSHGGFITVYSEFGKGTAFKVYLPAVTTPETLKAEEQQHELPAGHGESILIVDDEDQIREITRKTLETHGYKVITASDGKEAIALYSQHRELIRAVLMDMMMPVMDGAASVQELYKINPHLKIIAASGLTETDKLAKIEDNRVYTFLPKPYTAEILLKKIHEILDAQ